MKNFDKKAQASFQLVVLIVSVFAFSFIIYQATGVRADEGPVCCERTAEGAICQNVLDESECVAGFKKSPSACTSTSYCKIGCCIDDFEGTYDKNVPETLCGGANSRWEDDANCNVPGAGLGCCVLGDTTAFVTDTRCVMLSDIYGVDKNYHSDLNEMQCTVLSTIFVEGACMLGNGACEFTTQQECAGSNGQFAEGYLCTAPELNSSCERTDKTMCVDGKDGVYFTDSCGNPANIYDYDQRNNVDYWNEVISTDDSCEGELGNANSEECGNCNRFTGGICASASENDFNPSLGDYYCKQTYCDFDGERSLNGESWCVYDGHIGNGDDVVGSRHWKYVCNQGEVNVEPCADYRNQICVQSSTEMPDGHEFKNAACRVNNWRSCLSGEGGTDCTTASVNVDEFSFSLSVPQYPGGFGFGENKNAAAEICGMGTQTCIVQYAFEDGSCKPVVNEDCEKGIFTQQMNDVCRKLGDCGGYVNIEGVYTGGGYSIENAPQIGRGYGEMATLVPGQFAVPGNFTELLKAAGVIGGGAEDGDEGGGGVASAASMIGLGIQGAGYAMVVASHVAVGEGWKAFAHMWATPGKTVTLTSETLVITEEVIALESLPDLGTTTVSSSTFQGLGATWSAVANSLMVIGIIVGTSSLIVSLLGYETTMTGTIAGAVAGVAGTYTSAAISYAIAMYGGEAFGVGAGLSTSLSSLWSSFGEVIFTIPSPTAIIIGIAVATAIMLLFSGGGGLFGGEDCEPVYVTYTCKPWTQPSGGESCSKCNGDPLKPCSEYRCQSLGAACNLINKGTSNELCVDDNPNDITPPRVDPQYGTISEGHKYEDITGNGFRITNIQGGCLEAHTPLIFGIKTNEPAWCKFDLEQKSFDEMQFDLGANAYVYNHTTTFPLPDPSHGQSQGLNWTGDLTLYIKCQDTHGNEIPGYYEIGMCVDQGPDITPPVVQATNPADGTLLSHGIASQDVKIYTNEVSECRWGLEDDKTYEQMENSFECEDNILEQSIFGYLCTATLPIDSDENVFYIRCKDQPWLEDVGRGDERNANEESFEYNLERVENPLEIDWIMPDDDFEVSSTPATVVLKVQTSSGGRDHLCEYSFSGYNNMIEFFKTYSSLHEQEFILNSGNHRIYIECSDETGGTIQGEANFKIIHDTSIPQVARVYVKSGSLKIITTEDAECVYSTRSCDYVFEEGTGMGGTEKEHSITSVKGRTYYIKCKDEPGNVPAGCSIIVKAT